jgi:hypothetical protein
MRVFKGSKSFFDKYKRVFDLVEEAVKGFGSSEEEQDRRHLFTQRIFNRPMFPRFIQEKGWLTIDGSTDYLASLWASHGTDDRDRITQGCSRRRWLLRRTSEIVR